MQSHSCSWVGAVEEADLQEGASASPKAGAERLWSSSLCPGHHGRTPTPTSVPALEAGRGERLCRQVRHLQSPGDSVQSCSQPAGGTQRWLMDGPRLYTPVCSLIQSRSTGILVYTPGLSLWAQPSPQLTTPAWKILPSASTLDSGPPESP